jgi:peptidoglycan hydrolase-like protein with peptidoglycan-binding domain
MPQLSYRESGLVLQLGSSGQAVRDLQRDLRGLGYLRQGIDGAFREGTALAVKALRHDLLTNTGASTGRDGSAPVKVMDYNRGRVARQTGRRMNHGDVLKCFA